MAQVKFDVEPARVLYVTGRDKNSLSIDQFVIDDDDSLALLEILKTASTLEISVKDKG